VNLAPHPIRDCCQIGPGVLLYGLKYSGTIQEVSVSNQSNKYKKKQKKKRTAPKSPEAALPNILH
jgi:hypothetical protein